MKVELVVLMRQSRILDFIIFMTVAAVISTGAAIAMLFQAFETENYALKINQANSTIETLRWVIESEIEENQYYLSQNRRNDLENWQPSWHASLTALRFIELENEGESGVWETFYKSARSDLEDTSLKNYDLIQREEFIRRTEGLLREYWKRSDEFVEAELKRADDQRSMVTKVVIGIFLIHILLFVISVRLDLVVLKRELGS